MIYKIKELIENGYSVQFTHYVCEDEMRIMVGKNMHHACYILSYSDPKNSILDLDIVICQILDNLKSKVDDEIIKNMWRDV